MTTAKKSLLLAAALLYLIGWVADSAFVPGTGGKLDRVIAVYESKNQPASEASLLAGKTPRAIRKTDKWRMYDKDILPESAKPVLSPIVAKLGVPCLALIRGDKAVASRKIEPKDTDADLAAYIEQHGGF